MNYRPHTNTFSLNQNDASDSPQANSSSSKPKLKPKPKHIPILKQKNGIIHHDQALSYASYMHIYLVEYILGFVAIAITTLTEVMAPKLTGWTVDLLSSESGTVASNPSWISQSLHGLGFLSKDRQIYGLATIFACNIVLGFIFRFLWRIFLAGRTHHSSFVYRMRYWSSLRFTSLAPDSNKKTSGPQVEVSGDLISRGIADINPVRFIHGFTWAGTLDVIFFLVAGSLCMLWIDPLLAVYCLALFPLAAIPVWVLSQKQKTYHHRAQDALAELSDTIGQAVSTARLQRATATEKFWTERLEQEAKDYAAKSLKSILTANHIIPWATIPTICAYSFLVYLGVPRVLDHHLSAGDLVAMFSFVLLMQMPLFELGPIIAEWQRGKVSLQRLNKVITQGTPAEFLTSKQRFPEPKPRQAVSIENLVLRSSLQQEPINCQIAVGEKFGVIGTVGSGKSTLLESIAGNILSEEGQIKIFAEDLQQFGRKSLVEVITFVSQSPFLFSGSIRENLCLDQNYNDESLWQVLNLVQLDQDYFIEEHGLQTMIGEFGINLSGGQKQRLCLARALLRLKPIMIFDDCLSAVDTLTEEKILGNLTSVLSTATVIWSAHRPSTLRLCSRIMTLPSGEIQARGSKL